MNMRKHILYQLSLGFGRTLLYKLEKATFFKRRKPKCVEVAHKMHLVNGWKKLKCWKKQRFSYKRSWALNEGEVLILGVNEVDVVLSERAERSWQLSCRSNTESLKSSVSLINLAGSV